MRTIYSFGLFMLIFINFTYVIVSLTTEDKKVNLKIINPISQTVLAETTKRSSSEDNLVEENGYGKTYNILLLGLDGRRGDKRPRCDAIHIFSIAAASRKVTITAIPRGTMINSSSVNKPTTYLANNCHINGIDATIPEIEKIAGLKIDAYIKIGFSQTLGILRSLNFPTTPTLQFLRNRRYAIGDNQRSYNQAFFLKDMIISHFEEYWNLPDNFKYWIYKTIDTNINFETALYLFNTLAKIKIYENPDNIIIVTKPEKLMYVREMHITYDNNHLNNRQNDVEYKIYQKEVENYLDNLIFRAGQYLKNGRLTSAYSLLAIPFKQKLWLQIEDENLRTELYFRMMEKYLATLANFDQQNEIINDFIDEMKILNKQEYLDKVEQLINS